MPRVTGRWATLLSLAIGILAVVRIQAELRKPLSDADIQRLAAQWDEDDDLENEALEQQKKAHQKGGFDPSQLMKKGKDPRLALMAQQAKGQTKMMFVKPNPGTSKLQMEKLAGLWQGSLHNAHIEVKPFIIDNDRFMYTVDDGSLVPQITEFLQGQKEFDYLEVDQTKYYGKHSASKADPTLEDKEKAAIDKSTAKKKARAEYDKKHGLKNKLPPKPRKKSKTKKKGKKKKTTKPKTEL